MQVDWIEAGKELDAELDAMWLRVVRDQGRAHRSVEEIQSEIDAAEERLAELEYELDRAETRSGADFEREAEILIAHGRDPDGKIAEKLAEHRKKAK